MNDTDIHKVRQAARGRWVEIFAAMGIPREKLTGEWVDCPKCGAANSFALLDADTGACECRVCFPRGLPR